MMRRTPVRNQTNPKKNTESDNLSGKQPQSAATTDPVELTGKRGSGKLPQANLARLLPWLRPQLPLLILTFVMILVINGTELFKPYLLEILIDQHLRNDNNPADHHAVLVIGLIYLLCIVIGAILQYFQSLLITRLGQLTLMHIRRDVFSHILHLPMRVLNRYSSGRLITRATNDVETLNEFFTDVLVNLFKDVFLLVGIVSIMLWLDWQLALLSFLTIPLIVLVTVMIRTRLRRNFVRMKHLIGQINAFFAENIAGMRLIQLFAREKQRMHAFKILNKDYFDSTLIQIRLNSLMRPLMEVINSLGIALLIAFSTRSLTAGVLEIGVLYAFTSYIRQFFQPINDLAEKYSTIQSAVVSADRIFELLDQKEDLEDLTEGLPVPKINGRITFEHVWFAYEEDDWVLQDVSFDLAAGQKAAIVGATGAGKTTIISLLLRFYDCQKGAILLDGQDIRSLNKHDLRRQIAIVLQDVFLFSGSIAENIRLGDDQIDDDQVAHALQLAQAESFIDQLEQQMDTPVTERGSTFSAGQRQLLSFARAIAREPAVFILDEATAQIDSETEFQIQRSIETISRGRTTVVIAHRLSTIRSSDVILVLEHGRLAEQGDHESLLQLNGRYADLIRASRTVDQEL